MEKYLVPIDLDGVSDPKGFFGKMQRIHSDGTVQLSLNPEGTSIMVGFNQVVPLAGRVKVLSFVSEARRYPRLWN